MPEVPRFPRVRPGWGTLAALAAISALPLVAVRPVSDPSPWLHLKVGAFLLDGRRFGAVDPWAPFASHQYIPTQWLPSMFTAALYQLWGLPSVAWVRGAAIVVLFVALLYIARRTARASIALPVAALALCAAWPSLTERPQLLGFVLLVPVVGAWWQTGSDARPRWWLVPLTWLAASIHGVWALGLVIGGLVVLGLFLDRVVPSRRVAQLSAVVLASAVAAALTPLGPRLVTTPITIGGNARQFVEEWFASSARMPPVLATLVGLALVFIVWIHQGHPIPWWKILLFLAAVGFALSMRRTVAIGIFLAAPMLAESLESLRRSRGPETADRSDPPRSWEMCSWATAAAVALCMSVPLAQARASTPVGVPGNLEGSLRAMPGGTRIIGQGDITGWLLFAAPDVKPVFDLRIESYTPEHTRRYITTINAEPGWESFVSQTRATAALLPEDSALAVALKEQLHWRIVGTDAGYSLLETRR